jgi:hypothetical protein
MKAETCSRLIVQIHVLIKYILYRSCVDLNEHYIIYDSVCHEEGFGLLLAKGCDPIAFLNLCKQNRLLELSAYINWTAVYA